MIYEEYEVDVATCKTENSLRSAKEKMAKKLKKDLQDGIQGNSTVRHYICIPLSSLHSGHPVGETAGMNQNVARRIIAKIFEVVSKGITEVGEVRRCIADFVDKEPFRGVPVHK